MKALIDRLDWAIDPDERTDVTLRLILFYGIFLAFLLTWGLSARV